MEKSEGIDVATPAVQTLLLSIEETATELRIGRTRTYQLVMAGQIQSVMIGRRRLVIREDLERFVKRLSERGGVAIE